MDITYINSEFWKNHARLVDGVLGTDFLAKYGAVIDYAQSKLYIKTDKLLNSTNIADVTTQFTRGNLLVVTCETAETAVVLAVTVLGYSAPHLTIGDVYACRIRIDYL